MGEPRVLDIPPILFKVTRDQLHELRALVIRERLDWPAVFSCNEHHDIWPFVTYDWTPYDQRVFVNNTLLQKVVRTYLGQRPMGGRFFIDDSGVFFKEEGKHLEQFIKFSFVPRVRIIRRNLGGNR